MHKMALRRLREAAELALKRMNAEQLSKEIRSTAPFLIPFLKMTCAYFVLLLDKGSFPAAVVKCLPLLSLIWFVCLLGVADPVAHRYNRRVATALVWCCCGDFFLVWSDANEIFFFLGLGCFAVGHAVYSHAFGWTPFGFKEFVFICSLGVPAVGRITLCVTGVLQYAVVGYAVLLLVMQWRALARFNLKQGEIPWRKINAAIGATLFVVSDTLLAVNKFCLTVAGERYIVMVTYYAAQFFIALSVVNSAFLTPSNGGIVVVRGDEQNQNFHLNRTQSEGSLSMQHTELQKNRNEFHLNGTEPSSKD